MLLTSSANEPAIFGMSIELFAAWGQWAGGIGALLAVIVALLLAVVDGRRLRRERRDNDAAQARTIFGQVRQERTEVLPAVVIGLWSVFVDNHGTLPVTDVTVESLLAHHKDGSVSNWKAGDGLPTTLAKVIAPSESKNGGDIEPIDLVFEKKTDRDGNDISGPDMSDYEFTVTITFVDANGARWRRTDTQPPTRVLEKHKR